MSASDSLLAEGRKLKDAFEYAEAIGRFRQIMKGEADSVSASNIAAAFNGIGEVYYESYCYDTARLYFDEALKKARYAKDTHLEGVVLNNIALCNFVGGEYEVAFAPCDSALRIARALDDQALTGRVLWTLAHLYVYSGSVDTGFVIIDSALALARVSEDRHEEARALFAIGRFCNFTNEYKRGLAYCDSAINLARRTDDRRIESRVLDIQGLFYCQLSQYDKAIACLDSCLAIDRKTVKRGNVGTYLSLQWAHRALTHWNEALALGDSALAIACSLQDKGAVSSCLLYRGVTFLDFSQFDAAVSCLDSAYEVAEEINDIENMVWIRGCQGESYLHLKQYEQALEYLMFAHNGARKFSDEFLETGMKICIGLSYCGLNDYARALAYLDSALAMAIKINVVHYVAWCYEGIGSVHFKRRHYEKALAYYDSALVTFKGFKYKSGQAMMLDHLGQVYEELGDPQKAIASYKASIEIRESIRKGFKKEEEKHTYVEVQKDVYERLINVLILLERYEEAFEYMERSRSEKIRETLDEQGITAFDPSLKRILERMNVLEVELQGLNERLSSGAISRYDFLWRVDELEGEKNQALVDLKTYHPDLYNVMMPQIKTLEYLQKQMPENTAFIEYMVAGENYVIFLFSRDRFIFRQVENSSAETESLVLALLTDLKWLASREEIDRKLETLYTVLLGPVTGEIREFANLVVIPYGPLHYVPFHALRRESTSGRHEYLLEYSRVSYLPSALFLNDLGQKRLRPKKELIAFANCDGTLPSADVEVDSICRVYPDAYVCTGDSATKELLIECCGDYRMLHLATHGILSADPRFSYIVMAPAEEGNLTVREIMGLHGRFRQTSLVTLSACETAVEENFEGAGMELTTLSNAFKVVGVPSIVATLWEIADRSTAIVMKNFYANLKTKRMDKIEALRRAQVALLDHSQYSHPYYWAPFVMIGDWR